MTCANADHPSLESLAPLVRRTVWKILGSDTELNDVMHDAYIRIIEGMPRVREHSRLDQWAERVTVNAVYNALRRRKYRRFTSWDPITDPDVLVASTDFETANVARHVSEIMQRVPRTERVVLELRWFHGASAEEMGKQLGCSNRTAKRRLQRALKRFEYYAQRNAEVMSWLDEHRANSNGDSVRPRSVELADTVPDTDALAL